jgi:isomaltose glucohydrolase
VSTSRGEVQLAWIEASANDAGYLPEQVADQVQSPHLLAWWQQRWGPTVTPLLWSHAMHVILHQELQAGS